MQREITVLGGEKKVVLRETPRAVRPFGGLSVFIEFLGKIGYRQQVTTHLPVHRTSPNALDPGETFTAFLISLVAGARRFAHTTLLRADRALHALLGMKRFPTDDTLRNLFKRFRQGLVVQFYEPLWKWQLARVPQRAGGYSLDLDSPVFERYGQQEGVKRGYNPRKHGRASHHPLLAVWGEAAFILHGWLRSGNTRSDSGVVEFLKEGWAKLPYREWIRVVRADSGFFAQELLDYLEGLERHYIVVARLTKWLKREAARVETWRALDEIYTVGEFRLKLFGWDRERRLVVVRERLRETKRSLGRKLFDLPGYTFRIFVTNRTEAPEEIWRDYNQRAGVEQRIEEMKSDLAADDFCRPGFFATEAPFLGILMLFNLLRVPACQRPERLSPARHPARAGVPVRSHSGPGGPPKSLAPLASLGRLGNTQLPAGPHLEVRNPNFAEVGFFAAHDRLRDGPQPSLLGARLASNF